MTAMEATSKKTFYTVERRGCSTIYYETWNLMCTQTSSNLRFRDLDKGKGAIVLTLHQVTKAQEKKRKRNPVRWLLVA